MHTKANYSLKQFTSSSDRGFVEALSLYARYTPPALRTNTNEITYWVDNSDQYGSGKLLVMGFHCDKKIIGFAEIAYLPNSKVVIVDYLTIDPGFRQNNVYFEFIAHVQKFILNSGWDVHYVVAEVGKFDSNSPPESSRALVRLLKFSGFKVAKALYYQPQLGEKNADSEMEAILMVYPFGENGGQGEQSSLAKKTYMDITKAIYFDHYLQWYRPYLNDISGYEAGLGNLLEKIETAIKGKRIELNGHHYLLETGEVKTVTSTRDGAAKTAATAILVVTLVVVLIGALQYLANLPTWFILILFLIVFMSFVGVMASIKESPTVIFKETVKIFRGLFRKGT